MKLIPALLLLSCSLAFAQTPSLVDQAKTRTKAEVKAQGDQGAEKAADKVNQKTQGKAAEPVGKGKDAATAKVAAAVGEVAANKESKVFHKPTCKLAGKIKNENKASFPSKAEAVKDGYKACKICKP